MTDKTLRLILGNQLFPLEIQKIEDTETVFMCEDSGLCTYETVSYTHLTLPTTNSV